LLSPEWDLRGLTANGSFEARREHLPSVDVQSGTGDPPLRGGRDQIIVLHRREGLR